jgi:hypothetical protein
MQGIWNFTFTLDLMGSRLSVDGGVHDEERVFGRDDSFE